MNNQIKKRPFQIDHEKRIKRRRAVREVEHQYLMLHEDGRTLKASSIKELTIEQSEQRQLVGEMTRAFINTIEFYKSEAGGSKTHEEAIREALSINEHRRQYLQGLQPIEVSWAQMAALAEVSMDDGLALWIRLRETADGELDSGLTAAKVAGDNASPYELARFLSIRDQFADQWQPQGGIESAMVDMLTISYSLQLYWSRIAHDRSMRTHDVQREGLKRFESSGWKSPYQSEADAIDQAHRLADGYNRQFLRVLRQLRDLRRYAPVVIQNAQQVNLGNQQVNVSGNQRRRERVSDSFTST